MWEDVVNTDGGGNNHKKKKKKSDLGLVSQMEGWGGGQRAISHREKTALPRARYLYCSMSSLLPSRSTGPRRWQPLACRARTSR